MDGVNLNAAEIKWSCLFNFTDSSIIIESIKVVFFFFTKRFHKHKKHKSQKKKADFH